ncbi:hypothetical protein AB0L57_09980 [Nocardia sp. NPDC052254]|uniref:hypothetical protein n=1 Tax=Nocardia sp. NPDC052254 TaxID=3155681 RepID=UPI00343A18EC
MMDGGGEPTKNVGPVTTPGKKDKDPWKDVAKKTAAGQVRFDPAAAQLAAQECADAIAGILAVQKKIPDAKLEKQLSNLTSGGLLTDQFNRTLRGLDDVLETHKNVLNEMLNTFKAAGTKYIDTDLDSASGFDKKTKDRMKADLSAIKAPTKAGKFHHKAPKGGKESKDSDTEYQSDDAEMTTGLGRNLIDDALTAKQKDLVSDIKPSDLVKPAALPKGMADSLGHNQSQPEALKQWRLEFDSRPDGDKHAKGGDPKPENPASQLWRDLYDLGQSTKDAITPVSDAARMWNWMALELGDTVGALSKKLTNMPESLWKGDGADSAIGAVKKYHKKADGLTQRMKAVGSNLNYTSDWLADTHKGMPTSKEPMKPLQLSPGADSGEMPGGGASYDQASYNSVVKAQNERALAIYRQNMENNYVQGVQTSSMFVPALDELPTTDTKKPGAGDKGGGGKQSDGPGTTPGGATPGVGAGSGVGAGAGVGTGAGATPTSGYTPTSISPTPQSVADSYVPSSVGDSTDPYTPTKPAAVDPTDAIQSATTPSGLDGLGQAANLAQQGMGGAESAMQAAAQAAQNAAQQAAGAGLNAARANMPSVPGGLGASSGGGAGASKIGGGAGLSSGAAAALQKEADAARLFPRAGTAGPASSLGRLSGMPAAGVTPGAGTPGSPGAAGGQGQQQGKEHKRPKYLESTKHLEEALGDAPTVGKAVVEK